MKLIRIKNVINLTGLSRSHIYFLAKKKEFPSPVKLGQNSSAWVESEVIEWIEEKVLHRDSLNHD